MQEEYILVTKYFRKINRMPYRILEMRLFFAFLLCILLNVPVKAQYTREEYIRKYQLLAIEEMSRSGIPASIKMAQAVLESGNGNSMLAKKSNNHFGIKCKTGWQGQKVYHDDDEKGECFRKYRSVEESYRDHSIFLTTSPRYAFLFQLPRDDYKGWARGLKQAGYATARHYDNTLIKIIEDHKLYRLDYKQTIQPMMAQQGKPPVNRPVAEKNVINPYNRRQVIKINNLEAVVAGQGDTYEIIAQSLGRSPWEVYKFNDQAPGYRPQPSEVVYVESKKRKAGRKNQFHVTEPYENLHFISQMHGVKLKPLARRNRLSPGQQPQPGEVIYLRKKKPNN
jgi:hypothetical protein